MLSEAKIISIFCIVDDMLKACGHKEDIRIRVIRRTKIWRQVTNDIALVLTAVPMYLNPR